MTKEITLYPDGLVESGATSAQPRLPDHFLEKIEKGWSEKERDIRTLRAIEHLGRFFPEFAEATVGGPPLFGAQQIPGSDPTLRVAEVAFPLPRYARCEIVKVSSVTDMSREILRDLEESGLVDKLEEERLWNIGTLEKVEECRLARRAAGIARSRGYPEAMASLCVGS